MRGGHPKGATLHQRPGVKTAAQVSKRPAGNQWFFPWNLENIEPESGGQFADNV